jgi:hypothetical protein
LVSSDKTSHVLSDFARQAEIERSRAFILGQQYETDLDAGDSPTACLLDVDGLAMDSAPWKVAPSAVDDAYDDEYDDSYGMEFVKWGLNDATQDQLRCSLDEPSYDDEPADELSTAISSSTVSTVSQQQPKAKSQQQQQPRAKSHQHQPQQPQQHDQNAPQQKPPPQQPPKSQPQQSKPSSNDTNRSKKSKSHNRRDNAAKKRTIV